MNNPELARYVVQDRKSRRWVCGHDTRGGAERAAVALALHKPQAAHWVWDQHANYPGPGRVVFVADPELLTPEKPGKPRKRSDGKG